MNVEEITNERLQYFIKGFTASIDEVEALARAELERRNAAKVKGEKVIDTIRTNIRREILKDNDTVGAFDYRRGRLNGLSEALDLVEEAAKSPAVEPVPRIRHCCSTCSNKKCNAREKNSKRHDAWQDNCPCWKPAPISVAGAGAAKLLGVDLEPPQTEVVEPIAGLGEIWKVKDPEERERIVWEKINELIDTVNRLAKGGKG